MSVFYEKKESIWWFILGFICPPVGLILYFAYKETNLQRAKKAGIGALSMVAAALLLVIIVTLYNLFLDPSFQYIIDRKTSSSMFLK